jgi:hypothetical protein
MAHHSLQTCWQGFGSVAAATFCQAFGLSATIDSAVHVPIPPLDRDQVINSSYGALQRMRFSPESVSGGERIDTGLLPPRGFVNRPVNFAVMGPA